MTTESSSTGDPARTIALLWGTRRMPRRVPKHGLTSGQVIAAAIKLADADMDLTSLSMKRVAESLEVGTMSLYTYVASRDELLEAMLDTAYAEAVARLEDVGAGDWRDGLRWVAAINWAMYLGHPWMLQIFTGRPPLGPNAMAKYDLELRVVDGLGLSDLEMDAVISLVNSHVEGVARRKVEAALVERRTGVTDKQWWQATAAPLAEVFDPEQFPVANRVGNVAGEAHYAAHGTEYELTFGLDRLIDGIAAISRP